MALAARRIQKPLPLPPLDHRAYEGHEEWTNKRWAWEFLRRNEKFKEACDGLGNNDTRAKQLSIARKFRLTGFKHYSDPYESDDGTFVAPAFRSKAVVPIKPRRNKERQWAQQITILPGQIAIRFDLGLAVQDDLILKAQLKSATAILQRQLVKWREAKGLPPKKEGRNRKRAKLLEQLKILDALTIEATHAQRAGLLWNHNAVEKKFIDGIKDALEMAQKGYIVLASLGDSKPTAK
jgi:hypothetical protein